MDYSFLLETYETERLKTLSVWSMFQDADFDIRPHPLLVRDRTGHEHMVHQCMSEDKWFRTMFAIDVGAPPLPESETRLAFIERYASDSGKRLVILQEKDNAWWEQEVPFFDTTRTRAWVMVRRIAHTAHHRGEQTVLLRLLGRSVYSVYGPSVDTGGLPINNAVTIYPYLDIPSLLEGEKEGGKQASLPGPGDLPSTERPDK
jgi:uncharacterized damage-inducible protein DinB